MNLIDSLISGEVRVIFRKRSNNTIRDLLCTLNIDVIPPEQLLVLNKIISSPQLDKITVWDLEKNDWRSFYMDSVINTIFVESKKEIDKER
tara:strand:- start:43 stop:315 length:273 start_codon:yes stop_codon:yes gene_type:complete